MPVAKNRLTDKQRAFVFEYMCDLNATQAAIRAGYSKRTAQKIGSENLLKPLISAEIEKAIEERAERTKVTANQVIQELAKIAFANISDYVTWDDTGIKLKKDVSITEEQKAAISEIVETRSGKITTSRKFKLHDKQKALDSLGRHLGIFKEEDKKVSDNVYFYSFTDIKKPANSGQ